MRELLSTYRTLRDAGEAVGRAVVIDVWGSAPRRPGACMLATPGGTIAGSVSGGCVEGATAREIGEAIERGTSSLVEFGVTDETAWEVGLACGGTIRVLVQPRLADSELGALEQDEGIVIATVIESAGLMGGHLIVHDGGIVDGPVPPPGGSADQRDAALRILSETALAIKSAALDALHRDASRIERLRTENGEEIGVFLEVHSPPPTLVIFGGVHIATHLVTLAKALGYRTIVADGRSAFLTPERFPHADELVHAWPDEAFERIGLTASTCVCVLSHDPKFDDPALEIALRSPARYVGAIGSRRNQADRRRRLREAGLTEAEVNRLRGPIGLDLGGREPAETALAILAEITSVRHGGRAAPLIQSPS